MEYDVVIVGAGPAGSTAAKNLAEKGVSVLLLDKAEFPRDKPCGGGLPTRVRKRFPYIEPFIDSISYGGKTLSSSLRYVVTIERDKPFMETVLREKFDAGLLDIAKKAGVVFRSGCSVVDVAVQSDKVCCTLENGETIESQVIIGCDGVRSIVAEKTNLCEKLENFCICLMQEQPMSPAQIKKYFSEKRMVHFFIKVQGVAGYGWIFPKKNCVNLGIGEFHVSAQELKSKKPLKEMYEGFVTLLQDQKMLPSDFKIENLMGATLPVFPLKKTYADRVLLCGDAAGFINPITGEGIYYAMVSGQLSADVIADALVKKDTSEQFLSAYQRLWEKEFGKDLRFLGRFIGQWRKESERFVRLLTRDNIFAKLVIGIIGGQISATKYKMVLFLRYIYVTLKDLVKKK
jgi:geranylgeranyl reductase family protein